MVGLGVAVVVDAWWVDSCTLEVVVITDVMAPLKFVFVTAISSEFGGWDDGDFGELSDGTTSILWISAARKMSNRFYM